MGNNLLDMLTQIDSDTREAMDDEQNLCPFDGKRLVEVEPYGLVCPDYVWHVD